MKNEKLYDAISDIREEFIEEAGNYKFKKRIGPRLLKWGSMAACFCLVMLGASLAMSGSSAKKGATDVGHNSNPVDKTTVTPAPGDLPEKGRITVLAYNGALYNVSNELNELKAAGIPDIVTQKDCGLSLGNLKKTDNGYEETVSDTDIELYQYAAAYSNTAVYVIRDGEEYMAGLFSNSMSANDAKDHRPISALYRTYGVESAEDVASVVEVNSGSRGFAIADKITEQAAMELFYNATVTMESQCFSQAEFETLVLKELPEDEYLTLLESKRFLCITTAEGLKFYLNWYPAAGWMYSSGTTAYYKITKEMQDWLDTYMK